MHFFHNPETRWRFKRPHLYQLPAYQDPRTDSYRHRDPMFRVHNGPPDDRYLSPYDGHIAKLHVQATDELYDGPGTTTWRRTYVRNVAPLSRRIATWPIDFAVDPKSWKDWAMVIMRFIPASLILVFCVSDVFPLCYEGRVSSSTVRCRWKGFTKMFLSSDTQIFHLRVFP
jgi:hypothetical protein